MPRRCRHSITIIKKRTETDLDAKLMEAVGLHLHGDRWKKPLSEQLKITDRQVSRYVLEGRPLYDHFRDGRCVPELLAELLRQHCKETEALLTQLEQTRSPERRVRHG